MSHSAQDKPDDPNVPGGADSGSGSDSGTDPDTMAGQSPDQPETTDARGMPVDNPSGG